MPAVRTKVRALVGASVLVLSSLVAAPAAAAAEKDEFTGHCVLVAKTGAYTCYDTFDESLRSVGIDGEAALPNPASRQASATLAEASALLYNYKNWDASGGTLLLWGCPTAAPSMPSGTNDWVSSLTGYNMCAVRMWQHVNWGGSNTGWVLTSADLGDMNNKGSSYEVS